MRTEEGQIKDVNILDVTPENFIVPKGEEDCYHCRIEVKKFNQDTGERISKPRMQVFGKKFFESFGLHNLRKQGFTVDVKTEESRSRCKSQSRGSRGREKSNERSYESRNSCRTESRGIVGNGGKAGKKIKGNTGGKAECAGNKRIS